MEHLIITYLEQDKTNALKMSKGCFDSMAMLQ